MSLRCRVLVSVGMLLLLVGPVAISQAQDKRPSRETIAYGPHPRQKFVIWHAKGDGPRPVLVHFFGGAFAFGSPSGGPFKGDLMKQGVTVVGGGYRFRQDGATKREIMEDGARIIQYLRFHAERFNIDPDRIGVSGYSSGGVIASWIALHNDLRRPGSPDPVLRQSSRVSVCCLEQSQVHPLDLDNWHRYTGSNLGLLEIGVVNYVWMKLDGGMFRNPIRPEDYETVEAYKLALARYERDVFSFYQCSEDDPPICFFSNQSNDPNKYVRKKNGGGLHSPLLMIPMERRLRELGVQVTWDRKQACRDVLLRALVP